MEKDIIKQAKYYLERTELKPVTLTKNGDILEIICSQEPTDEHLVQLRSIIFSADNIVVSSKVGSLISTDGHKISIQLKAYEIFNGLYKKLGELGVKVLSAEFGPKDVAFTYVLAGRFVLNYAELEELQNIINPAIEQHDSIRVIGDGGSYTLRATIS